MEMMSVEALEWLKDIGYFRFNHDERIVLIKAAKILFPEKCLEDGDC